MNDYILEYSRTSYYKIGVSAENLDDALGIAEDRLEDAPYVYEESCDSFDLIEYTEAS